jgi:hypothetical protein
LAFACALKLISPNRTREFSRPRLAFRRQSLAIQTSHTVPVGACYLRAA